MVCVYFEGCNIWGGTLLVVQIANKVTSIDLDIATSEGVSGEPFHSSSVSEQEDTEIFCSNDIFAHIVQCSHSFIINLNRQKAADVQCAKLRLKWTGQC